VLSALASSSSGFQVLRPSVAPQRTMPSTIFQLHVSTRLPVEEDDVCNAPPEGPATVFGRPIDHDTKEANRKFIKGIKSFVFDTFFDGTEIARSYARFWALEEIARMPYFSYLSVLHLYESMGMWRKAEYLKVHFSQSWNEQHHLLIMEEMGGNRRWVDRFIAQHIAVAYYWMVIALYTFNPTHAYNLNQAVEEEAFATYSGFLVANEDYLKTQPPPKVAKDYYEGEDMYLFDTMSFYGQGNNKNSGREARRPKLKNLFDVFSAVRDDEAEHVKTMAYLQDDACL